MKPFQVFARDYKQSVRQRIADDPAYAKELRDEIDRLLASVHEFDRAIGRKMQENYFDKQGDGVNP